MHSVIRVSLVVPFLSAFIATTAMAVSSNVDLLLERMVRGEVGIHELDPETRRAAVVRAVELAERFLGVPLSELNWMCQVRRVEGSSEIGNLVCDGISPDISDMCWVDFDDENSGDVRCIPDVRVLAVQRLCDAYMHGVETGELIC
jgi:hypothetical protein